MRDNLSDREGAYLVSITLLLITAMCCLTTILKGGT